MQHDFSVTDQEIDRSADMPRTGHLATGAAPKQGGLKSEAVAGEVSAM